MDALELLISYGHVEPAEQEVLDAAAAAVLDAAERERRHVPARRPARPRPVSRRPRRALVAGTGIAAAAACAVAAVSLSTGGATGPVSHLSVGTAPPQTAGAAPSTSIPASTHGAAAPTSQAILTRLASAVRAAPAPAGDATLVIRSQVLDGGAPILGADLYTDNGKYYYAPSEAGLPAQVTANHDQGNGIFAREVAAAEQAASAGNLTDATHAMEFAPDPTAPAPTSPAIADNWLWENSLDALTAGAGNPTVRAGVIRLVSTLPEVQVADTTADGQSVVQITATFPNTPACTDSACAQKAALAKPFPGLSEQLTLDAATGIPVSFAGGAPGQPPSTLVTYQVSRVSVAEVAQGHFVADPAKA